MKIRVLGGGWYGCHIAKMLKKDKHEVELHEISNQLFSGASGGNPARLHLGFHYPRSRLTRAMSQEHHKFFMGMYGHLTRAVPVNIYAVADKDSMVDYGTYLQVLRGEVQLIEIDPEEFGLVNVEGAILTGERHIVIDEARKHFESCLYGVTRFGVGKGDVDSKEWDVTVDCTFCSMDNGNIDRYEPCVTALLRGPTDRAVTIMDGPFPSVYPWNEKLGISSLTSAKFTPIEKCATRIEAQSIIEKISHREISGRINMMFDQIASFCPMIKDAYELEGYKLTIRAMPRSGAAARLVDVVRVGERAIRVRAGKIDAIQHAYEVVKSMLAEIV